MHEGSDPRAALCDAVIIDCVAAGETEMFAELVRRYQPALVRVARSRLGRSDWADDVVQETFLAAFKSCATYDPRYNFRTWLWTILLNQCHAHYQRRMGRPSGGGEGADPARVVDARQDPGGSPLAALLAKERSEQLELLLAELTPAQADALRLRFFGGLKFYEIAEAMQCGLNTAKSRVRVGLVRMAAMLTSAGTTHIDSDDWHEER